MTSAANLENELGFSCPGLKFHRFEHGMQFDPEYPEGQNNSYVKEAKVGGDVREEKESDKKEHLEL